MHTVVKMGKMAKQLMAGGGPRADIGATETDALVAHGILERLGRRDAQAQHPGIHHVARPVLVFPKRDPRAVAKPAPIGAPGIQHQEPLGGVAEDHEGMRAKAAG